MKLKTLLIAALISTSFSAMAWNPFNGNGYNNGNGNFVGDGNFGFNMNAQGNARGNGNASSNNGTHANNANGNGNFVGNGNFGFNMNANARGNGNGWGNSYNSNNPYYAPSMTKEQIKAQADYYKNVEKQRQAFYEAQKKAYDDYAAMMNKSAAKK